MHEACMKHARSKDGRPAGPQHIKVTRAEGLHTSHACVQLVKLNKGTPKINRAHARSPRWGTGIAHRGNPFVIAHAGGVVCCFCV